MGLRDWLGRLFRKSQNTVPSDTVRFYDIETQKVVNIPRSELRPGVIEAQVQGMEGVVWISPDQLTPGPIQHPPFEDDVRDYIRQIHSTFEEHQDLSLDQWEDGFRRDATPEREIALWLHAAGVYTSFTENEPSAERRRDIYQCIVACLTASPDTVWNVLEPGVIDRSEAEQIVRRFYGKNA